MDKEFYTTFELAKLFHVSPGSIVRWIHDGKIKATLTGGGHHRVAKRDAMAFMKKQRMPIPEEMGGFLVPKVLIVDDEESIRHLLKHFLEQNFPGCQIEVAMEGFVAGWKAHGFHPDLVFLDIMLPGLDGLRVCKFIRSFPELTNTTIIAISGVDDPCMEEKCLKAGADRFIGKPFELSILKQEVAAVLFPDNSEFKEAA